MTRHILLQNATILIPSGEKNDQVLPLRGHSLLISDTKISQIAPRIVPPTGAQLIDCTGKIVSPGFIDSHHHVWQTQLKGRHANHALLEYLPNGVSWSNFRAVVEASPVLIQLGNLQHANYTPDDVFWGELAGCLEALDSGTTTIVDHAHMNDSPAHSEYCFAYRKGVIN
jgi:cytosine/adenosine deaminase-related metal-dependent hydrolase